MSRPLGLKPRLLAVVNLITPGERVADIGTDHARLPVYLIQQSITNCVYATDICDGPLQRAKRTINIHKLNDHITLIKCNGATGLAPELLDTAIVAGMGAESILDILKLSPWLKQKKLILQPMTRQASFPALLEAQGYTVRRVIEAVEGRRLYKIFLVYCCY